MTSRDIGKKVDSWGHIPCAASLKRWARMVEQFAVPLCPFTLQPTSLGEMINFDIEKTLRTVLDAFGLLTIAKEKSVCVTQSIDGAQLSKNLSHTTGGFKIGDRCARCPFTKKLVLNDLEGCNAQSRSYCFPLTIVMNKETKESFQLFEPMFHFFEDCTKLDTNRLHDLKPLIVCVNCDMSAQWKGLCKGGGKTKHRELPCHCCPRESHLWHVPNDSHCSTWCQELYSELPTWKCYHRDMMSEDNVGSMEEEIEELTEALSWDLDKIHLDSKMDREDIESSHADSKSNPCSIHFLPTSDDERQTFSELVSAELILRDLPPLGALSVRREHLHTALKSEKGVRDLLKTFKHSKRHENALFLLIQAIPCILHMENRVGLKILTMLLITGLSNARKHLLYGDELAEGMRIEHFFTDIECILNTKIIGDDMGPSQWQCPRADKDKKEIGTIMLDNNRTRKVVK